MPRGDLSESVRGIRIKGSPLKPAERGRERDGEEGEEGRKGGEGQGGALGSGSKGAARHGSPEEEDRQRLKKQRQAKIMAEFAAK